MVDRKQHWNSIYSGKTEDKLSWTQASPSPSLEWIIEAFPNRKSRIVDVGGGLSSLVEHLLAEGYERPAILDISPAALKFAQQRLGAKAFCAEWIEADATHFQAAEPFDLWHDRAVFHFLTNPVDRRRYCEALARNLKPQGKVLIATFSPHGPSQCSGLEVKRFDAPALADALGASFRSLREAKIQHTTPWGANQEFQYCLFERVP